VRDRDGRHSRLSTIGRAVHIVVIISESG